MNLNLNTVELVSAPLVVPANGAASSSDFNDLGKGILADLASLASLLNDSILPLVNSLKAEALPLGIEGGTIFSDTGDRTSLFFDGNPLTVADSIRLINSMLGTFQTQLNDMTVQVASVQTKLASDNRNDIASALQNLTNSMAQVTNITNSLSTRMTAAENRQSLAQYIRVTTGAITTGATVIVNVTFATAFLDNSFTVAIAMEDSTGKLLVQNFNYQGTPGVGIQVHVNNSGGITATGNIHVHARHD